MKQPISPRSVYPLRAAVVALGGLHDGLALLVPVEEDVTWSIVSAMEDPGFRYENAPVSSTN